MFLNYNIPDYLMLGDEGRFLVRESTTLRGDYALSVLSNDEVHHIQICRHDNDAFFSIGKEKQYKYV